MEIIIVHKVGLESEQSYEFVERKGLGHPDTLADALAEELSCRYSQYTKEKFGAVLHHNFDKVGLLGGSSYVKFGSGIMVQPIRVLLNGRASTKFGNISIPIEALLIDWTKDFFRKTLPIVNPDVDLEFHMNLSNKSSPGRTDEKQADKGMRKYWFEPRSLEDLQELKKLLSNDTSLGVGYAPLSKLENLILEVEGLLNSPRFKSDKPWLGSDIKLMGFRMGEAYRLTLCVPQIANFVSDAESYKSNLYLIRETIVKIFEKNSISDFEIFINTRDNFETSELYLTATGSSIESGDEGLVGRGNRINGLISPMHLMSMEGACGKNPVYHIGKVYYVAANEISKKIYDRFNISNEVSLASQSGRELLDPWKIIVSVPSDFQDKAELKHLIEKEIISIPEIITDGLLSGKFRLF